MPDTQRSDTMGAPEKTKRSRITAACAVCRAKRQKCSGEKPTCDQCRVHNEHCHWSDQKKRGPAKDYLRSLQDRLQETERLLLGTLNRVSDADLVDVLQAHASDSTPTPSHQTWAGTLSGPDYWAQYPMNHLESIRDWQRQRESDAQTLPPTRPIKQATGATGRTTASEANMRAPTAVMAGDTSESQNGSHPYYQNGFEYAIEPSLRNPPAEQNISHERRYSEETRGVAEALFSISANGGTASRQPEPQSKDSSMPEGQGETRTSPKANNPSGQFPKELFW